MKRLEFFKQAATAIAAWALPPFLMRPAWRANEPEGITDIGRMWLDDVAKRSTRASPDLGRIDPVYQIRTRMWLDGVEVEPFPITDLEVLVVPRVAGAKYGVYARGWFPPETHGRWIMVEALYESVP
jgi:hypothetical protein